MNPTIKLKVDRKGDVSMEVENMTGIGCEELTRAFQNALGVTVDVQQKPAYFAVLDDTQIEVHEGEE